MLEVLGIRSLSAVKCQCLICRRVLLLICAYMHSRLGIYPFKTGDRHKNVHFFVEFDQEASVKRARAHQVRDAKVHIVAFSPELTEDFTRVAPPASERPSSQWTRDSKGSPLRSWNRGRHSTPEWYYCELVSLYAHTTPN